MENVENLNYHLTLSREEYMLLDRMIQAYEEEEGDPLGELETAWEVATPRYNRGLIAEMLCDNRVHIGYTILAAKHQSDHPDDHSLFVVIAQMLEREPSSRQSAYVVWNYNAETDSFYQGYYCDETREAAIEFDRRGSKSTFVDDI